MVTYGQVKTNPSIPSKHMQYYILQPLKPVLISSIGSIQAGKTKPAYKTKILIYSENVAAAKVVCRGELACRGGSRENSSW